MEKTLQTADANIYARHGDVIWYNVKKIKPDDGSLVLIVINHDHYGTIAMEAYYYYRPEEFAGWICREELSVLEESNIITWSYFKWK